MTYILSQQYIYTLLWLSPYLLLLFRGRFNKKNVAALSYTVSTYHSLLVSLLAILFIFKEFDRIPYPSEGAELCLFKEYPHLKFITMQTVSYLFVDILVLCFAFRDDTTMFIHHFIAMIALQATISGCGCSFVALYYAITELSTPFLNFTKYLHKNRDSYKPHTFKAFYSSSAALTLLTFFSTRIVPIPYMWLLLYHLLPRIPSICALLGILSIGINIMNIRWFYKLVRLIG